MTKTYETLYGDIMQRIERSDHAEFAKKALSLAVFARRPLTTSELLHALAVNPEDTSFDDDNIPNIEVVMSACAGLLTIHEESDVVYLAHQTAQEYLRHGTGNKRFLPDAKAYIASVCISYLSFDDFEAGFCATDADLEARLSKHPFYGYAARNWGHHAREASLLPSDNTTRLGIFCGSPPKTEAAAQAMLAIKEYSPWSGYSQEAPRGVTCLHMAARFGATEMAKDLLRQSGGVAHVRGCDVLDSDRRSPLMWAVALGNLETAQMLLEAGADPNLKDKDGRTPLSIAAENGSTEIIEALLREERLTLVGDSQRDEAGRSPLSWAARSGHVNAVRALLAHSDLEAGEADNPLLWAILSDSDAVVATILEAAVQRAGRGWKERIAPNALCLAAETGQTAKFTHLLSALGCDDVNCQDGDGMTPLMKAVLRGHEDMTAALLLRLGADPSLHDRNGRTAFSLAATFGHDALVTLLLRHARDKIDVEDTDLNGRTSLSLAAEHGHETIVKTLLELEGGSAVDVDRPDTARQTPLFWAARGGHGAVVRHLLDTGRVDVNAVSVYGQTPLSKAVEGFHVATVKILQEHGAVTAASVEEGPLAGLSLRSEDGLLEEDGSDIDYDYHSDEDDD
jgi:ankyrin repeat protein